MIDYNLLLPILGGVGLAECILFLLLSYFDILNGINSLATIFIAYKPSFRCDISSLDNFTLKSSEELSTTVYDNICFSYNLYNCSENNSCIKQLTVEVPDCKYQFDNSLFEETVVTEFDLICGNEHYEYTSTSVFYLGRCLGSLVFGFCSDNYGRKKTLMICMVGVVACMFGLTFSTSLTSYFVFRFFCATFVDGCNTAAYVFVVEMFDEKWRTSFGVGYQFSFSLSYIIISVIAFHFRHWRSYMLVCSFVCLPAAVIFFLPESPRWLFAHNRTSDGKKVVRQMARINKVTISEEDWKKSEVKTEKCNVMASTARDLFSLPYTRLITFNMIFSWFVNSSVYYGLALNSGQLAGDIFINSSLGGVVEILVEISCIFMMMKIGRRYTVSILLIIAGVTLLISLITLEFSFDNQAIQTISVVFALIGKGSACASFCAVFNYTAELYPTVTRANALAISSAGARVGSIVAPFIIVLQKYRRWLPNIIFSVLALLAGLFNLYLPETKGQKLFERIDEAEEFFKSNFGLKKSTNYQAGRLMFSEMNDDEKL